MASAAAVIKFICITHTVAETHLCYCALLFFLTYRYIFIYIMKFFTSRYSIELLTDIW